MCDNKEIWFCFLIWLSFFCPFLFFYLAFFVIFKSISPWMFMSGQHQFPDAGVWCMRCLCVCFVDCTVWVYGLQWQNSAARHVSTWLNESWSIPIYWWEQYETLERLKLQSTPSSLFHFYFALIFFFMSARMDRKNIKNDYEEWKVHRAAAKVFGL